MKDQLQRLVQEAEQAAAATDRLADLTQLKAQYLGKKGQLTAMLKQISSLPVDQRPQMGQLVNEIKQTIAECFQARQQQLEQQVLQAQLDKERLDVTLPGLGGESGSLHPVTLISERIQQLFHSMGFVTADGPEIEDDFHNFTALNIPEHHPAREMQDTFYCENDLLLRAHTSSVQIRTMLNNKPPFRVIAPGRVYRCDSDRTHSPMFHQVEGLLIDKGVTFAHLKGLLQDFFNRFFEADVTLRFRPSYFPFTEPSAEVDIRSDLLAGEKWLEVMGCGMVHPNVLCNVGIDPDEYSGFAFGLGIDRMAMLRYHIPDLRLLFENDVRFLKQF